MKTNNVTRQKDAKVNIRVGVAVFIVRDGRFIMQKRVGAHGSGSWSVPGGHMEFGELPEAAAQREAYEETGCRVKNVVFVGFTNDIFEVENKHYITLWFVGDWDGGRLRVTEPDKCIDVGWFSFNSLPSPLFCPGNNYLRVIF